MVWAEPAAVTKHFFEGRPTGIVGVSRNIDQRKQLESA